ncbi:MAG: hypothetical protein J5999_02920 [Oscillospiraceae bacterium]|nr:hypothetical protein [Oscillospiraceae bacterium]
MEMFADRDFYLNVYKGEKISEEKIDVRLAEASAVCGGVCLGRLSADSMAKMSDGCAEKVRLAVCVQADFIEEKGGLYGLSSDSIGSYKLGDFSYSDRGYYSQKRQAEELICPAAYAILEQTGLTFRGVAAL